MSKDARVAHPAGPPAVPVGGCATRAAAQRAFTRAKFKGVSALVPLIAFLCVEACGGGPEPMPTTLDGCAALSDDGQREDCRLQVLGPLYTKNRKAFDEGLKTVDDPLSRDLVRLRLAIDDPSSAEELCKEVETDGAREKCRQVLGRPHLRAKRHDDEGPDGAEPPPGPPPGSPPPGSPPSGSP